MPLRKALVVNADAAASADISMAALQSPIRRLSAARARSQLSSPQKQPLNDEEREEIFKGLPLTTLMMKIGDGNLSTPDLRLANTLMEKWRLSVANT